MKKLNDIIFILLLLLIIIPLVLIGIPLLIIWFIVNELSDKLKLKKMLRVNDGKIYLVYHDYNDLNFEDIFKNSKATLVEINDYYCKNILYNHFKRTAGRKAYPRLILIHNKELIIKDHYSSFKHYVKKKKDVKRFSEEIQKSIKNLSTHKDCATR